MLSGSILDGYDIQGNFGRGDNLEPKSTNRGVLECPIFQEWGTQTIPVELSNRLGRARGTCGLITKK